METVMPGGRLPTPKLTAPAVPPTSICPVNTAPAFTAGLPKVWLSEKSAGLISDVAGMKKVPALSEPTMLKELNWFDSSGAVDRVSVLVPDAVRDAGVKLAVAPFG